MWISATSSRMCSPSQKSSSWSRCCCTTPPSLRRTLPSKPRFCRCLMRSFTSRLTSPPGHSWSPCRTWLHSREIAKPSTVHSNRFSQLSEVKVPWIGLQAVRICQEIAAWDCGTATGRMEAWLRGRERWGCAVRSISRGCAAQPSLCLWRSGHPEGTADLASSQPSYSLPIPVWGLWGH